MTQTQRRQELLGVFYYQSIEARQRRVEKLCENAESVLETRTFSRPVSWFGYLVQFLNRGCVWSLEFELVV
jgi:hypothetical protein